MVSSASKPIVLFLSLAMQPYLDDSYSSLIDQFSQRAQLKRAKSASGAIRFLDSNSPRAIIVTDEGIIERENKPVLDKLISYVRGGGLAIIGLHFPNITNMDVFDHFFHGLGLPWKHGGYHRTTFQVNSSCALPAGVNVTSLPGSYSMKALHVKDALADQKISIPKTGAMTQSLVFPPAYVDRTQAAIVGAKMGDGYLVYDGSVNPEDRSVKLILSLCRL